MMKPKIDEFLNHLKILSLPRESIIQGRFFLKVLLFIVFLSFNFSSRSETQHKDTILLTKVPESINVSKAPYDEPILLANYEAQIKIKQLVHFNNPQDSIIKSWIKCPKDFNPDTIAQYSDSSYVELVWNLKIDSAFGHKIMGLQLKNCYLINAYYDGKKIIEFGNYNPAKNQIKPFRLFNVAAIPFYSGNPGIHRLCIRYYRPYFYVINFKGTHKEWGLYKDFYNYASRYTNNSSSFYSVFMTQGHSFFVLCVFVIGLLFYLMVERSKPTLWFMIFSLCLILLELNEFIRESYDYPHYFIYIPIIVLTYSFIKFYYASFYEELPKRIVIYFRILSVATFTSIAAFLLHSDSAEYILVYVLTIPSLIIYFLFFVEIVVHYTRFIFKRKNEFNFIGIGIILCLLVFFFTNVKFNGNSILDESSPYTNFCKVLIYYFLPISFLISIIQLVKKSFSDNIEKQKQVVSLTQFNNKILEEQNLKLEAEVSLRTIELKNEKLLLETKNKEILDSIEYALRIQSAILPSEKHFKEILPNSFVLYMPKDIVAGDFYWIEKQDNTIYLAACDCTGHGVPGALVSVVCNNALNRALNEFDKKLPGEILDKTRELVIENFARSDQEVQDGMDASLIAFDYENHKINWSGANNPIWIYRKQLNIIEDLKPNKQPVGIIDNPLPFTTHVIDMNEGDIVYLFTDGYSDQFGGPAGLKLTRSKFKQKILDIAAFDLEKQRVELLAFHNNYKGIAEQIDDICVIAFKM